MKKVQNYEKYWKITLAYTDFNDDKFLTTLEMIVDKIDDLNKDGNYKYNPEDNKKLQLEILNKIPKPAKSIKSGLASTRKAINECIKLGFVNPKYQSYHPKTKEYLNPETDLKKREVIFSEIVYSNARFNNSVTKVHNWSQINFFIKTLEEVGILSKKEIIALMTIDIANYHTDFATKEELVRIIETVEETEFNLRKYNQIYYLKNILSKLENIVIEKKGKDYFVKLRPETTIIIDDNLQNEKKGRDKYLHRLYKIQLMQESILHFEDTKCMVEQLSYPTLIASHIKPFIKSNEDEAYDPNNGILLSRNIDSLFDLGYITFSDNGEIIFATHLKQDVKEFISNYSLDNRFINAKRLEYLEYHRKEVFEKRYKYA